jgi:hypothetical protein
MAPVIGGARKVIEGNPKHQDHLEPAAMHFARSRAAASSAASEAAGGPATDCPEAP